MATHRINRLEIEISVEGAEQGQMLIDRLSVIHDRLIAPLIDRVCSELSGPAGLDRIAAPELVRGAPPVARRDEAFVRALELALRAGLARQLAALGAGEPPEAWALELLESFARTGNLPWSAGQGQARAGLISTAIDVLLDRAPDRWFGLLDELQADPVGLARLAQHCGDAQLETLTTIAARSNHQGRELVAELGELEPWILAASAHGSSRVAREQVRVAWLATLGRAGQHSTSAALLRELVERLVALAPLDLLRADPRRAEPSSARLRAAIASVRASLPELASPSATTEPSTAELEPESEPSPPELEPELEPDEREPSSRAESTARAVERQPSDRQPPDLQSPDPQSPDLQSPTAELASERSPSPARIRLTDSPIPPSLAAARRRALARLDEIEVDNAGLVILWPFLDRFFQRVGLLDLDRRFLDESAAIEAVALLAQIANDDPEPPEFVLALAKLLCGRAVEAPVQLAHPLAPESIAECDHLLSAVIANAPILRDMSIADFRASFLHRPALLSIRDGAWLLRVERRPHDLVLDRFPWSWSWVKLPWMTDPLHVEW